MEFWEQGNLIILVFSFSPLKNTWHSLAYGKRGVVLKCMNHIIPFQFNRENTKLFTGNLAYLKSGLKHSTYSVVMHSLCTQDTKLPSLPIISPKNTFECQNETTTHKPATSKSRDTPGVLPVSQNLTKSHLEYNH